MNKNEIMVLSKLLGLLLQIQNNELQLVQQATNERLLPPLELAVSLGEAERHLQQEIAARRAAEAEIERLRAEIERLKGKQ
jgi:AmiR/NasT family two-component response regulator